MTNPQVQQQTQPQYQSQVKKEHRPKGYDSLSDEYKQMWDDIINTHPWIIRDKDINPV